MASGSATSSLLGTCASLLVCYYLVTTILAWRRLRHFPGPLLASVSYLWIAETTLSKRMWKRCRDVSKKYGSLVRIGPNELLTDDPELIRRMSAARSQYTRSSWYQFNKLDPYEDNMFSLRDTVAHDKMKAKTAAAYAGRENPSLEMEVDSVLAEMVDKIRAKYISAPGKLIPLDLAKMSQYFTLDSITKIAFGQAFGFLTNERDMFDYMKTIEDVTPFIQTPALVPFLANILSSPIVIKLAGPKYTDKRGMGRLMGCAVSFFSS